jgi:hypothetical protein
MFWALSGDRADVYFRRLDQSDPDIQSKMLQALQVVRESPYVSKDLSPKMDWLSAFHTFVAENQPGNITTDGMVKQAAFYDQLDIFLDVMVRTHSCLHEAHCENKKVHSSHENAILLSLAPPGVRRGPRFGFFSSFLVKSCSAQAEMQFVCTRLVTPFAPFSSTRRDDKF